LACGNPDKLAKPYDPDRIIQSFKLIIYIDRACGVDQNVENYPYIYFATPDAKFLYRTVCVKACPNEADKIDALDCAVNSVVSSCKLNPQVTDLSNSVLLYNTIPCKLLQFYLLDNNVCLPTTKYYYLELYSNLFPGIT